MDGARFTAVREALARLLLNGLESVDELSPQDIRPDGLPQNWVDDIPNLDPEQRTTLAGDIPEDAPEWALALKGLLLE